LTGQRSLVRIQYGSQQKAGHRRVPGFLFVLGVKMGV
jgi:hypothetical protein